MVAMFGAIEARGAVPLARVLYNEPWMVNRVLDLGAAGVIVPLVGSAADAKRAVSGCRYPPRGVRSYGPLRAALTVGSADPERLAAGALCFVMVETREGLEHVEEIAATRGLDGIYIGPSDLSLGLGREPGHGGDVLEQAIDPRRARPARPAASSPACTATAAGPRRVSAPPPASGSSRWAWTRPCSGRA